VCRSRHRNLPQLLDIRKNTARRSVPPGARPVNGSLEDLARRHARSAIEDDPDGRWASVTVEAWAAAGDDVQFRAALLARNRAVNASIARHIEEVAARSGLQFPYSADTLAQSCGGMLRGLLLQRLLDTARVPSQVIEDAFAAFVRGMASPRAAHKPDRPDRSTT
jgi:BetI-type transcriptional repressor, C-terminal